MTNCPECGSSDTDVGKDRRTKQSDRYWISCNACGWLHRAVRENQIAPKDVAE